ncbi:hypothetical protein BDY21DRAFT_348234 [Lineolata rhizophorae]|uniref:Cyclin N-terminal domain-containing protein n=1 Tax=Lineolata rhizophorae TaxID=578093 RepID=A0A6A6NWV6_9PEZI|nr:hypothetical protein BDY21DRAFT_348234 [Lineolata rhizophorae]
MDTPQHAAVDRRASVDSFELDSYLANYVPLSNFPTPPPATSSFPPLRAAVAEDAVTSQAQDFGGPAIYMASLVPSKASLHGPSIALIQEFLARAQVPDEVIGLAACVLDSLSWRFVREWRQACSQSSSSAETWHNGGPGGTGAVGAEVIVLSALALAETYLSDEPRSSRWWSREVSSLSFSAKQINTTNRCILVDIDYGLHDFTAEMIDEMLWDMRRAERMLEKTGATTDNSLRSDKLAVTSLSLDCSATLVHGLLTPEPSPPLSQLQRSLCS